MSDMISRQAAIDAIHNYWKKRLDTLPTKMTEYGEVYADIQSMDKILEHNKTLVSFIKTLPSAHPEIVRCKDCIRYGKDNCFMKIQMLWELKPDDFCSYAERRNDETR